MTYPGCKLRLTLNDLTYPQLSFALGVMFSDGIERSPLRGLETTVFARPWTEQKFQYIVGGTETDRKRADRTFLKSSIRQIFKLYWSPKSILWVGVALCLYARLRANGRPFFRTHTDECSTWNTLLVQYSAHLEQTYSVQ